MAKIVFEKSALSSFLDELPTLMLQYHNAAQERQMKSDMLEKENELYEDRMKLQHVQDLEKINQQAISNLEQTLSSQGVIFDDFESISDDQKTKAASDILSTNVTNTTQELTDQTEIQEKSGTYREHLLKKSSSYSKGALSYNLAMSSDADEDNSGALSVTEIDKYVDAQGDDFAYDKQAFKAGMSSKVAPYEVQLDIIEKSKGGMESEELVEFHKKKAEQELNNSSLILAQNQIALESAEYTYDSQKLEDLKTSMVNEKLANQNAINEASKAINFNIQIPIIKGGKYQSKVSRVYGPWEREKYGANISKHFEYKTLNELMALSLTDPIAFADQMYYLEQSYDYMGAEVKQLINIMAMSKDPTTQQQLWNDFAKKVQTYHKDHLEVKDTDMYKEIEASWIGSQDPATVGMRWSDEITAEWLKKIAEEGDEQKYQMAVQFIKDIELRSLGFLDDELHTTLDRSFSNKSVLEVQENEFNSQVGEDIKQMMALDNLKSLYSDFSGKSEVEIANALKENAPTYSHIEADKVLSNLEKLGMGKKADILKDYNDDGVISDIDVKMSFADDKELKDLYDLVYLLQMSPATQ